jgi:hypothetical protein
MTRDEQRTEQTMTNDNMFDSEYGRGFNAARAVFEKAHAPIEDEPPMCGVEHPFNGHVCSLREGHPVGHICDYKRPEAHAPTDDELARLRHVAETMRAVSDALRTRYADDSQAGYFMREINAALDAVPEPQSEPSDAQVGAAMHAVERYYVSQGITSAAESVDYQAMRAALRAAGEVKR